MESDMQRIRGALGIISDMCDEDPTSDVRLSVIGNVAKAALSIPLRNCDVGTPEERMCRYNRVRDEIKERYERLGEIPPSFAFPTAFEWEDRPYEKGGAE